MLFDGLVFVDYEEGTAGWVSKIFDPLLQEAMKGYSYLLEGAFL